MSEAPPFSLQPVEPDKRGSRLPHDWKPTEKQMARARGLRPDVDHAREAILFRNYWTGKPGKDGRMLDWDRCWDSWILKAPACRPSNAPRSTVGPSPQREVAPKLTEAQREANRKRFSELMETRFARRPTETIVETPKPTTVDSVLKRAFAKETSR